MAGNTKLMGFGADNTVQFTRWGGKATISLSEEAIQELRRACHELLPKKPPEQTDKSKWWITYDEAEGRVRASISPLIAKQLAELLRLSVEEVKEEDAKVAIGCAQELEDAYQEHLDYLDTHEPGIKE